MTSAGSIGRNTAWLLAGRLVAQGLTILVTVLLAHRLGLVGLGEYALVAAVGYLANVATTFGTDMVLIRDIAGRGRQDGWSAALAVQLGLSAIAGAAIWAGAPAIPGQGPDVVAALRIGALSLVPAAFFSVATAVLRGAGKMGRQAALGVVAALLQLAAVWAFVTAGTGLVGCIIVLLGAQVAAAIAAWLVCAAATPTLRTVSRPTRGDIVAMARASAPIGALGLLGVLYQRAALLTLAVAVGPAATGWFAGASRVVDGSKSGHVALYGALYPGMAAAHAAGGGTASGRTIERSGRLAILLAGVISAGLILLAPFAVDRLFGPAFAPASLGVAILALSLVPSTFATYQGLALVAAHRERLSLRAQLLGLAALGVLLALLVPTLGWLGSCWAVVGAETVQALTLTAARRGLGVGRLPHVAAASAAREMADGLR